VKEEKMVDEERESTPLTLYALLLYFKLIDKTFDRICSNGKKLQKHLI